MSAKETLIAAKALISDPANWIKGQWQKGNAFCAEGALFEVDDDGRGRQVLIYVLPDTTTFSVIAYNDAPGTTHADVMAWFNRAIDATRV